MGACGDKQDFGPAVVAFNPFYRLVGPNTSAAPQYSSLRSTDGLPLPVIARDDITAFQFDGQVQMAGFPSWKIVLDVHKKNHD